MVFTVGPGEVMRGFNGDPAIALPAWRGHSVGFSVLSPNPEALDGYDEVLPGGAVYTFPGRFVPVEFGDPTGPYGMGIGSPTSVSAPDGDLFPGVSATVTAENLTPGEELGMWLVDRADYFWFYLTMASLPIDAIPVGSGTVAPDGSFSSTFVVPTATPLSNQYQLLLGDPDDHHWPAGSYEYFDIAAPDAAASALTEDGASTTTLTLPVTEVSFAFPAGTTGGTTSAAVSSTGPAIGEFTFASDPPMYYHLDTTAVPGGPVEVCVTYDAANIPGEPPRLYHHEPVGAGGYTWTDITTIRTPGRVCGQTTSFSPFVLGYPPVVDDGSIAPPAAGTLVSDNGWNGVRESEYTVFWTLREGENASLIRLLENGAVVGEQAMAYGGQGAQRAVFPVTGKPDGSYVYTAELENSRGVTTTGPLTVKVTDAAPSTPVLSHSTIDRTRSFTLKALLLFGTNATSYTFYEGSTVIGQGTLTARTPLPQLATLKLANISKGTHTYRVQFTNSMGSTMSSSLSVKVK